MFDNELKVTNWNCFVKLYNQVDTINEIIISFHFNDNTDVEFIIDYHTITYDLVVIYVSIENQFSSEIANINEYILIEPTDYRSKLTLLSIPYLQILKFTDYTEVESDGTKSFVTDANSIINFAIKVYKYAAESNIVKHIIFK